MNRYRKWLLLFLVLFLLPATAAASTVYELQNFISGTQIIIEQFTADVAPPTYKATITDLSNTLGLPDFSLLNMSITQGATLLGKTVGPGSFFFDAVLGQSYYLNILGLTDAPIELGLFNVTVQAVPVPPAVFLLGSGILGLVLLRRKARS